VKKTGRDGGGSEHTEIGGVLQIQVPKADNKESNECPREDDLLKTPL